MFKRTGPGKQFTIADLILFLLIEMVPGYGFGLEQSASRLQPALNMKSNGTAGEPLNRSTPLVSPRRAEMYCGKSNSNRTAVRELEVHWSPPQMPTSRHIPSTPSIQGPTVPAPQPKGLAPALERNIQAMVRRRAEEAASEGLQARLAQVITDFSGSMMFVYFHLLIFGGWIAINLGWVPFAQPWDPSLVILAMVASVEAIFLSTFVLMSQNRMSRADDRRADLNLQISLLAEHETTKLVELVAAIADQLQVEVPTPPEEIKEIEKDVAPEAVLDAIEESKLD